MRKQTLCRLMALEIGLLALLIFVPVVMGQTTDGAMRAADAEAALRTNGIPGALGDVVFEVVGQVTNFATTPATSKQVGYFTALKGVEPIFNSGPQDETTALFSFFTEDTTMRVINNGALRIINREGTTTIYVNNAPNRNFANLDSFRVGTPVQVSDHKQQVIIDTISGSFSVVNVNTITSVDSFTLGGDQMHLGRVGQTFRTSYAGHVNTVPGPPAGHFAGYAVGFVTVTGSDQR